MAPPPSAPLAAARRPRPLLPLLLPLLPLLAAAGPKGRRKKVQGPKLPVEKYDPNKRTKIGDDAVRNWQDDWRRYVKNCEEEKRWLFLEDGKLVPRSGDEMTDMLAEQIGDDGELPDPDKLKTQVVTARNKKKQKALAEKKRKEEAAKKASPPKLSRKERVKQELAAKLGTALSPVDNLPNYGDPREHREKELRKKTEEVMLQVFKKTKLPRDWKYTLREFCDVVFRASNPSPLDASDEEQAEYEEKTTGKKQKAKDVWEAMDAETKWWEEAEEESETDLEAEGQGRLGGDGRRDQVVGGGRRGERDRSRSRGGAVRGSLALGALGALPRSAPLHARVRL